ncbi:metallophosphoesterase [soil metagenome]
MVKALVVADEVVESFYGEGVRRLEPDIVLAAGDLPWDYLESLSTSLEVPVVFVPGNHDPQVSPTRPRGLINADTRVVDVMGLRIAGLGGCVRYNRGPHQYTQRQFTKRARQVVRALRRSSGPAGVDVLLTHAPPYELGDDVDLPHVGIAALHGLLENLEPTWLLHGHIHPYGQARPDRHRGRTTIRNVVPWKVIDIEPRGRVSTALSPGQRSQ